LPFIPPQKQVRSFALTSTDANRIAPKMTHSRGKVFTTSLRQGQKGPYTRATPAPSLEKKKKTSVQLGLKIDIHWPRAKMK